MNRPPPAPESREFFLFLLPLLSEAGSHTSKISVADASRRTHISPPRLIQYIIPAMARMGLCTLRKGFILIQPHHREEMDRRAQLIIDAEKGGAA